VSALPRHAFGPSEITWWGNISFMIIEGFTLVICAVVYLYLRRNFDSWPPLRTFSPDLIIPTASLFALILATVCANIEGSAARRYDLRGVQIWAGIGLAMDVVVLVLRWFELSSLNTRWDNDAYGSIVWFTIGFHATLLLLVFLEDFFFALVAWFKGIDAKQAGHVVEKAEYANFVCGIWILLYVLLYLSPHFI
jgi:cytochrome c oxidase subunit 3